MYPIRQTEPPGILGSRTATPSNHQPLLIGASQKLEAFEHQSQVPRPHESVEHSAPDLLCARRGDGSVCLISRAVFGLLCLASLRSVPLTSRLPRFRQGPRCSLQVVCPSSRLRTVVGLSSSSFNAKGVSPTRGACRTALCSLAHSACSASKVLFEVGSLCNLELELPLRRSFGLVRALRRHPLRRRYAELARTHFQALLTSRRRRRNHESMEVSDIRRVCAYCPRYPCYFISEADEPSQGRL